MSNSTKQIAIIGGGPSGLFMYKRIVEAENATAYEVHIFEKTNTLGSGMPYNTTGANKEHITNVSANEIPLIVNTVQQWSKTVPAELLADYGINVDSFNEYKVLPRLFFGKYLAGQFQLLLQQAKLKGVETHVHYNTEVADVIDNSTSQVGIKLENGDLLRFDKVIICTGHFWPKQWEGLVSGYFDSPYPPQKLALKVNYPVAIKGASLTAIDAIRTLSRANGEFYQTDDDKLEYRLNSDSSGFRLVMHSISGLLPAVRFHLEDPHLTTKSLLTAAEIAEHIDGNHGFLSLDYIFEKDFKEIMKVKDAAFYKQIADMSIEQFVAYMMEQREAMNAFDLFKKEYDEAENSIEKHKSIYWKEALAILSFAMNYPAKYFSAEDMQRLQKVLKPLIAIVIAFVPQSSAQELLALHEANVLDLISVDENSRVIPNEDRGGAEYSYTDTAGNEQSVYYKMFIDCIGQPPLSLNQFPFQSLVADDAVTPATIQFKDPAKAQQEISKGNEQVSRISDSEYYLQVPGIAVNDAFQVIGAYQKPNERIFIMAVPYMGGYNPDYSGLDFCEEASKRIMAAISA